MPKGFAYIYAMEKTAECKTANLLPAIGGALSNFMAHPTKVKNTAVGLTTLFGVGALSANIMSTVFRKIENDTRRKAVIEDLASNDPILKSVDKEQLKEWFATIYYYSPSITADKASVREVLQGFARFGRVDIQTLKLLADTEEKLHKLKNDTLLSQIAPKLSL